MSIVKRQNSKNFFSEFVLNGKRYIKSTKTTNRTLASKIDQQYYNEAVEENALGGDRITLKEAMDLYLQSKRANPQRQKVIGYFIEWINKNRDTSIKLHDVDTKWLHHFVNIRLDQGLKPSSVRINLLTITGTINHCKKLGYNVCPKLEMPTFNVKNEKTRVLTVEEEEKLFNELLPLKGRGSGPQKHLAQMELYTLCVILSETACRHNEIVELKWSQVDLENKVFQIWRKKTSSASVLPISNRVYDLLVNKKRICDWVFPNVTNDGPKVYNRLPFEKACQRVGLEDVTFHTFRHSRITRCLVAGMSTTQVKTISGHSDLKSLQRYSHLTSGDVLDQFRDILDK
jgi:integrase